MNINFLLQNAKLNEKIDEGKKLDPKVDFLTKVELIACKYMQLDRIAGN